MLRRIPGMGVLFSAEAEADLARFPVEARRSVVHACEALAELAALAPVRETPGELPTLTSTVAGAEITYELRPAERALWIVRIARRS